MDTAAFMAALNTVEQDHQLVLAKVQALKDTVQCLLDPREVAPDVILGRLRDLNSYFASHLEAHLDEEEVTLFPFLERRLPGGQELVARLRQEHERLRGKRQEMDGCLEIATELEDHVPLAVMRDLLAYGWELWELLDDHAHTETRAVRQCLAAALSGTPPTG